MNYIDANELVFNNDKENGIYSGGFSVNSIMMKGGMSPIITLNNQTRQNKEMNEEMKGGMNNVSDIFNDLVVPNWTLSYHNMYGGSKLEKDVKYDNIHDNNDDDTINDDIHDKLLDLVKHYDKNNKNEKSNKERKKGGTRKIKKSDSNKTSTKRNKKK
jgi:hypothetical protein